MSLHLGHIRPGDCVCESEPADTTPMLCVQDAPGEAIWEPVEASPRDGVGATAPFAENLERDTRPDPEAVERVAAWCEMLLDLDSPERRMWLRLASEWAGRYAAR